VVQVVLVTQVVQVVQGNLEILEHQLVVSTTKKVESGLHPQHLFLVK